MADIPTAPGALDTTVDGGAGGAVGAGVGGARPARTTVLPRVEVVDSEPLLVVDEKRRYEHGALLGEGGVGQVIKALDNDIARPVAIKRLRAGRAAPAHLARFVDEIRLVGQLEHPNIVPIHDVGVDEQGEIYFVMKYVEGETLQSIISRLAAGDRDYHRRYPFERRVEIFHGILDAVGYAHARGIIHRDIKPANIMVGPHGEVMVMDWGIARRVRDAGRAGLPASPSGGGGDLATDATASLSRSFETGDGGVIGTPLYMSPEQARGEALDERSDIYSLCVLFHELLTLQHYLADRDNVTAVLAGVLSVPAAAAAFVKSPHQPAVPAELSWFLHDGLAKDPARRYPSISAMIARLHARAEGRIPIRCHITFIQRSLRELQRFVDRHPMGVTAALTATILALLALLIWSIAR